MKSFCLTIIAFLFISIGFGQIHKVDLRDKNFVFFGLDFSAAKMIGSADFPNGFDMVNEHLEAINQIIIDEPKKFDIKKTFKIFAFDYDLQSVRKNNKAINHRAFITDLSYHFNELKVEEVVKSLDLTNAPTVKGVGFVFIVESFNKDKEIGYFWCTFFDLATKEILGTEKMEGEASGIKIDGHWANSVYRVMKKLELKM